MLRVPWKDLLASKVGVEESRRKSTKIQVDDVFTYTEQLQWKEVEETRQEDLRMTPPPTPCPSMLARRLEEIRLSVNPTEC